MPKRRVTILYSSGLDTSLGIFSLVLELFAGRADLLGSSDLGLTAISAKDAGHVVGFELVVEVIITLNGRSPTAGANAFHFFKRKNAVGSHAVRTHTEFLAKTL